MRSQSRFLSFFLSCTDRSVKRRAWPAPWQPWRRGSVPFEAFTIYCDYFHLSRTVSHSELDWRLRQIVIEEEIRSPPHSTPTLALGRRGSRRRRHQSLMKPPLEYRHYHYPLCSLALLREVERGKAEGRKEGRKVLAGSFLPSFGTAH